MNRKERAAFVLAGHALGARLSGIPVIRMSVIPTEDADSWIDVDEPILPNTGYLVEEHDRIAARALIVALLAGPAAGEWYSFGTCGADVGACRDLLRHPCVWRATSLARRLGSGNSTFHLLWRTAALVASDDENWSAVEKLATCLLDRGELTGAEIAGIAVP